MRKFRNQPPTPQQIINQLLRAKRKLRYRPIAARIIGWLDWHYSQKTQITPVESFYERMAHEYYERFKLKIREIIALNQNMLEGLRNSRESNRANIAERLPKAKEEVEFARGKLEESLQLFGFSAWRWSSVAKLIALFSLEAPLNLVAFMGSFGDSPILTLSSVLAVSAAVPSAAHAAGKLLKSDKLSSRLVGAGFVLLLVGLVLTISVLRRDAFEAVAHDYAGIVTSSSFVIASFYFLIQLVFIAIAVELSYAYSKPVDEAGRGKRKMDQTRFKWANKHWKNAELSMVQVEHELTQISAKLAWHAELETLSLQRVDSEYRELIEIYRRARWRGRNAKDGPTVDDLEKGYVSRELKARRSDENESDPTNGVGRMQHPAARYGRQPLTD